MTTRRGASEGMFSFAQTKRYNVCAKITPHIARSKLLPRNSRKSPDCHAGAGTIASDPSWSKPSQNTKNATIPPPYLSLA
mmetsp:Transcript_40156/g.65762  ORF Transcript_40156/g.65762 Transcript_40156/m.65762 type:complete len:80 (-) Transcript_40156:477-716(-)